MAMTEAMIRDLYARQAKPGAVLVTIESADLAEPIRLTDQPGGLTVPGSPPKVYAYAPFSVAWGGAGPGEAARRPRLRVGVGGETVELIRAAVAQPSVTLERVRLAAPGVAEQALRGGLIGEIEVDGGALSISFTSRRDYASEPACRARYTLSRTPALS